jgi:hypothetical protein
MRLNNRRILGRLTLLLATALIAAGCTGSAIGQIPTPGLLTVAPVPAIATASQPTSTAPEAEAIETGGVTPPATALLSPSATAIPARPTPEISAGSPALTETPPAPSSHHTPTRAETTPTTAERSPDAMLQLTMTIPVTVPTVLYQDDFTNPKSGWPDELAFQDYYVGYHEPDFYHVEVHAPNDSAIVVAPGQTFDNYQAETQVTVSKANTAPTGDFRYGLVVRRAGNHYYAFTISPRTKTWYVLKSGSGNLKVLAQGTQETIRGLEALDSLRVNADGPVLTFFINDQNVSQVNDPDYTKGEVGFYVETFDSPKVHAHFHNLVVNQPMKAPPEASSAVPVLTCAVTAELLKLRSGPNGGEAPTIAGLFKSTQLEAIGRNVDGSWIRVRIHGGTQEGWVSALPTLVTCDGAIASLMVSEPQPSSTP